MMQGRRVEFRRGFPGDWTQPGDYCKVPDGIDPRGNGSWYVMDPTGHCGAVLARNHTITEHEDGTITLSPSLAMKTGWHGFLQRGVWSA